MEKSGASLSAILWDIDGVVLESEDLHRQSYNASFEENDVRLGGEVVNWSEPFYDELSHSIGGGKPKMNWFFSTYGWPTRSGKGDPPATEEEQKDLIDTLQEVKTRIYQETIASGKVPPRPGVRELMDEARGKGLRMALCSASTKSSAEFTVNNLLGTDRVQAMDCFLAGDDVGSSKKPDPTIYLEAAKALAVPPEECLVIEDSLIGVQAARRAGMRVIVTYTRAGQGEDFGAEGVERILSSLDKVSLDDIASPPSEPFDDRISTAPHGAA